MQFLAVLAQDGLYSKTKSFVRTAGHVGAVGTFGTFKHKCSTHERSGFELGYSFGTLSILTSLARNGQVSSPGSGVLRAGVRQVI